MLRQLKKRLRDQTVKGTAEAIAATFVWESILIDVLISEAKNKGKKRESSLPRVQLRWKPTMTHNLHGHMTMETSRRRRKDT